MCGTGWSVASVTLCVCFFALLKENCLSYEHQTRGAWQSLGMHWTGGQEVKGQGYVVKKTVAVAWCLWSVPLRPWATYCCRHGLHVIWLLRFLVIWLNGFGVWTKWLVNAGQIDLTGLPTSQISTYIGSSDNAIDGDNSSYACTEDTSGQPWWMIDLGATYKVTEINITFPDHGGDLRNYLRSFFVRTD